MKYDPARHHRRSIRLRGYDYTQAGAYFITICTHGRECLFGEVADDEMHLNEYGRIVRDVWFDLPNHVSNVVLDAFVVMPNHVHGVVVIVNGGVVGVGSVGVGSVGVGSEPTPTVTTTTTAEPTPTATTTTPAPTTTAEPTPTPTKRHGLPEIVRQFKTFSARRINEHRGTTGTPVWQRNYYEHIIRDDASLNRIRQYILNNPIKWALDGENPVVGVGLESTPTRDESWRR
ncbi:transposase [Meiothermus cerbereus]|uniref:transposase n=1 Tax=Meiothermus cerbereus TaxID=65552 RepID=UPI003EEC4B84